MAVRAVIADERRKRPVYPGGGNYVIPKYDGPVICTYDLTKFGASVVMDALRTHPFVIIGGLLQENPFFVSPDQLLLEIRERRPAAPDS